MRNTILFTAISLALGIAPVTAQTQDQPDQDPVGRHQDELERITVRAFPLDRTQLESAEPVDILVGEMLDDRRGVTLGETLQNQPGVHSTYYGPGSGRPVIRGLSGPRVQVLEDGLATGDASAPSDDHAVSLDPLLVDQIEILRGPATLLYGSAATGGVVNVIDNRIPERIPDEPLQGRYEVRGDSVADGRSGVLRLDGGAGNFAWHIDGSYRDAGDYDIPGLARRMLSEEHHDDHDDHRDDDHDHDDHDHDGGTLENSFVESRSGTVGASWIGDRGFVGASFRVFETEYGIPAPHSHGDHDHDHERDHEHDEHDDEDEESFAFIDMRQRTWNLKAGLDDPLPGLTRATLRLGYNDYRHFEIEMEDEEHGHEDDHEDDHDHDHDHEPTLFDLETFQARLELRTAPLAGWAGALGLQFDSQDFVTRGEEAFVPPNQTDSMAVFTLQERRIGDVTLSLGGRIEQTDVSADIEHHDHDHDHDHDGDFDIDDRTFTTWSASMGAIWRINDDWQSSLNFSRAQRAPSSTELFADGPHLATFSFERGDPTLHKETTNAWDLGIHRHSRFLHLELNLFQKDVKNFVYLDDTGEFRDGLAFRQFRQANAEFYGLEALATWRIHDTGLGDFDLRTSYDMVRGQLDEGADLPRISPQRLLVGLDWHTGPWRGGLEWQRVFRQDRVGEFEGETPGYNLTHATLAYQLAVGRNSAEIFLQGRNLGNNEARVHTSSLREFAPLPGRNFRVGLRGTF